jgi:hypothetical protein
VSQRLSFPPLPDVAPDRPSSLFDHEHIFWLGDLKYCGLCLLA